MTAYELLDLRATTSDSYWNILRSWLTVTFACFGAANLIGGGVEVLNYLLLLIFYALVTVGMLIYLGQIRKEIEAVEGDLAKMSQEQEMKLEFLQPETIKSRVVMVKYQHLMGGSLVLALGVYLWILYATGAG